jgi:amino acid adenylation domain-containing protein
MDNDCLFQMVSDCHDVCIPLVDLTALTEPQLSEKIASLSATQALGLFDLEADPLVRFQIGKVSATEYLVWITFHHIIFDDRSFSILMRDFENVYHSATSGELCALDPPSLQYADIATELTSLECEEDLRYWRDRFMDGLPAFQLPTDIAQATSHEGGLCKFIIAESNANELYKFAKTENISLFTTLLSIFHIVLARYSRTSDVLTGVPVSGRARSQYNDVIGCFVNVVPIRTEVNDDLTFREYAHSVHEIARECYAHQSVPYYRLVKELCAEHGRLGKPLVQVVINKQDSRAIKIELEGLTVELLDNNVAMPSKFDLSLLVSEKSGVIQCALEYSADLFSSSTISRIVSHYQTLLSSILADPDARISSLEMLPDEERHRLLVEWNATERNYPRDKCLHQLFEDQAFRTPDAVAVVFDDQSLTYRELNARSNQLARYLRGVGVGAESLVPICVERSLEMVVGLLGILKAGGAYVPIDPNYPSERIGFMLSDMQAPVLLTQLSLRDRLSEYTERIVILDLDWASIALESVGELGPMSSPQDLAYVIYTSGSTGQPKGSGVYHRGLVNLLDWYARDIGMGSDDRVLLVSSFAFDLTQKNIFGPLLNGGQLYIRASEYYDPVQIVDAIFQEKITVLNCTPSSFYPLLECCIDEDFNKLASLRLVVLGGETINAKKLRPWSESPGFSVQIVNSYGPTECTDVVGYHVLTDEDLLAEKPIPLGKPIPNVQLRVLDEYLQLSPIGVYGELCISGDCVGSGYINRPDLTFERFIRDPFSEDPSARLYRTGDLACWSADGALEFKGRLDDQVKIRGYRVELGEIEKALLSNSEVRDAVVVVHEEEPGGKRLAAYYTTSHGRSISPTELRRQLQDRLPGYMVPAAFVRLEQMPLTPNGKIDRTALPPPETSAFAVHDGCVAPRTPEEELLCGIWADVLQLERVGIHDNFFEIGGHSLLATLVVSRIREAFKIDLPLRAMFEHPTIIDVASALSGLKYGSYEVMPITTVDHSALLPLSFSQQRLWFLDQLTPGSLAYNISVAFRLTGYIDSAEVVNRFETSRYINLYRC